MKGSSRSPGHHLTDYRHTASTDFRTSAVHARGLAGHRGQDDRVGEGRKGRAPRCCRATRRLTYFSRSASITRPKDHRFHPTGEDVSRCTARYLRGPVPAAPHVPARASSRHFKLMKVAGACWRGVSPTDVPAHLRARPGRKDDLRTYLDGAGRSRARSSAIGRELDLFHLDERTRPAVFWHPRAGTVSGAPDRLQYGRSTETRFRRLTRGSWTQVLCGKDGLAEVPREHVHDGIPTSARYALQTDELPGHPLVSSARAQATATCRCFHGRVRLLLPQQPRASCTASCGCASSARTTPGIFCTPTIGSRGRRVLSDAAEVYADFGLPTPLQGRHAARGVPRRRGVPGTKAEHALMAQLRRSKGQRSISTRRHALFGRRSRYTLKDALGREWRSAALMQVDFFAGRAPGRRSTSARVRRAPDAGHAGRRRQPPSASSVSDQAARWGAATGLQQRRPGGSDVDHRHGAMSIPS